jgi:TRAP-type uncharacterized transport system fused permease subunit
MFAPLAWWERLLATAAAFSLVLAMPITDEVGFALAALFLALQWWRGRRSREQATVAGE